LAETGFNTHSIQAQGGNISITQCKRGQFYGVDAVIGICTAINRVYNYFFKKWGFKRSTFFILRRQFGDNQQCDSPKETK
jgi:hypothetical protein